MSPLSNPNTKMEREGNAFYVVRKGNMVAVYKSLSDCQAQVSPSVCGPAVSVYKGYSLRRDREQYLASLGLKNASYVINEADVHNDLFGDLVPCPFQEILGSTSISTEDAKRDLNLGYPIQEAQPVSYNQLSCIIEFDGASKGNPGKAGAGAILRTEDGQLVYRLREGLGIATNNVAEYRGLILGLRHALKKGFKLVRAVGDSQLVCMQMKGIWQTKHQNMIELCKQAKELKDKFLSFQIVHVRRELNSQADAQANLAINLQNGEVHEERG